MGERVRFVVLAAQREGQRLFADALKPLGVTPTQSEALRVLADREPLTLAELGSLLIAETGSPSRLVSGLVRAGHVHRATVEHDRRAVLLTLTVSGRRVAEQIAAAEDVLHAAIARALIGHDVDATLAPLRTFVAGRPTGEALRRRGL